MTDVRVEIDRLRLRLRGVEPAAARTAVEGLAPELASGLLPHLPAVVPGTQAAAKIHLGSVAAGGMDPASVRAALASALASAIARRISSRGGVGQ